MILHEIMMTWKDSIKHLAWSELKNLLLVSLKSFISGGKLLLKYFWWFIILDLGLIYPIKNSLFVKPFLLTPYIIFIFLAYFMFSYVLFFLTYAVLRPSLERKDLLYFKTYLKKIVSYAFLLFMLFIAVMILLSIIIILLQFFGGSTLIIVFQEFFKLLVFWLMGLILLFYLDSKAGISNFCLSVLRTIKVIIYFFPFFLILSLFIAPVELFSQSLLLSFNLLTLILFEIIILPIRFFFSSVLVNYYVKIKHTQHKLFFK